MIHVYQATELPNLRQHCIAKLSDAVITPVNIHDRNAGIYNELVINIFGFRVCVNVKLFNNCQLRWRTGKLNNRLYFVAKVATCGGNLLPLYKVRAAHLANQES